MTMAAAGGKQGTILDRLWTAHLLPRPKEWKETITLKKKTEKGQKRKKEKRGKLPSDFSGKRPFIWVLMKLRMRGAEGEVIT